MNALTEIPQQSPSNGFSPAMSALMLELAKCLKLVAPTTMTADAQMVWLQAAVDALEDIRADEVKAISAELRRTVTRPNQIVPEVAKLVAEKRKRSHKPGDGRMTAMEFVQRCREYGLTALEREWMEEAKRRGEI